VNVAALKEKYFDWSMLRWFLVGCITFLLDYGIFISLYGKTGPIKSVVFANFCSGIVSTTFNYIVHYRWTFKSGTKHTQSGIRYLINLVVFWIIGTLALKGIISLGVTPKLAKLIPVVIVTPFSYFVLNYIVFKKEDIESN
jgi:putative flippase GtrA